MWGHLQGLSELERPYSSFKSRYAKHSRPCGTHSSSHLCSNVGSCQFLRLEICNPSTRVPQDFLNIALQQSRSQWNRTTEDKDYLGACGSTRGNTRDHAVLAFCSQISSVITGFSSFLCGIDFMDMFMVPYTRELSNLLNLVAPF